MSGLIDAAGNPAQSYAPPKNGDVMACAKPKCKTCHGSGMFKAWVHIRAMPCENIGVLGHPTGPCAKKCACEHDTQVKTPKICQCAVNGWQKKHGKKILTGEPIEIRRDPFTGKQIS